MRLAKKQGFLEYGPEIYISALTKELKSQLGELKTRIKQSTSKEEIARLREEMATLKTDHRKKRKATIWSLW